MLEKFNLPCRLNLEGGAKLPDGSHTGHSNEKDNPDRLCYRLPGRDRIPDSSIGNATLDL